MLFALKFTCECDELVDRRKYSGYPNFFINRECLARAEGSAWLRRPRVGRNAGILFEEHHVLRVHAPPRSSQDEAVLTWKAQSAGEGASTPLSSSPASSTDGIPLR